MPYLFCTSCNKPPTKREGSPAILEASDYSRKRCLFQFGRHLVLSKFRIVRQKLGLRALQPG